MLASSIIHWSLSFWLMLVAVNELKKIVFFNSDFPGDILSEISEMDFTFFNNETGSYQQLVPPILHFFHLSKSENLEFWEAASIRSAIKFGGMQTIFIHTIADNITGRYFEALQKLISEDNLVVQPILRSMEKDLLNREDALLLYQVFILSYVGGIILPQGGFLTDSITDLLKYECSLHEDAMEDNLSIRGPIMAHSAARIFFELKGVLEKEANPQENPLTAIISRQPHLVHSFSSHVLSYKGGNRKLAAQMLLGRQGRHLTEILKNEVIVMDPAWLAGYDEHNIKQKPGNVAAILRSCWYDVFSFVK